MLFVVELVTLALLAKSVAGFDVPLIGAKTIQLPNNAEGINISVGVVAAFEWPFFLAIFVAGLCVAARLYHRKVVGTAVPPLSN